MTKLNFQVRISPYHAGLIRDIAQSRVTSLTSLLESMIDREMLRNLTLARLKENTMNIIINPETDENDYSTTYYLPVTLRQIEEAGIETQGGFGWDKAEHDDLLDEPGHLRLRVRVVADNETGQVGDQYEIECYQTRIGQPTQWEDCERLYSMAEGHREQAAYRANMRRMEALALRLWPNMPEIIEAKLEEWRASLAAAFPEPDIIEVETDAGCPNCGDDRADSLENRADGAVLCHNCGAVYRASNKDED